MDGETIIRKIKQNDKSVIVEIYKSYRNEFIAFTFKQYRIDPELSKEIYQDAFLAFYRNIITGRLKKLESSVKTYLFQIGKFKLHNELKRQKRTGIPVEKQWDLRADNPDVFRPKEEKDILMQKALVAGFKKLSEKCRQLLRLFYYEHKHHEEIMQIMDYATVDSVKTQKYKCFKKLESVIKSDYSSGDFF